MFDSLEWTFILATLKHFGFNKFGLKLYTATFKHKDIGDEYHYIMECQHLKNLIIGSLLQIYKKD
jgi:hypothetical protein